GEGQCALNEPRYGRGRAATDLSLLRTSAAHFEPSHEVRPVDKRVRAYAVTAKVQQCVGVGEGVGADQDEERRKRLGGGIQVPSDHVGPSVMFDDFLQVLVVAGVKERKHASKVTFDEHEELAKIPRVRRSTLTVNAFAGFGEQRLAAAKV